MLCYIETYAHSVHKRHEAAAPGTAFSAASWIYKLTGMAMGDLDAASKVLARSIDRLRHIFDFGLQKST